MCNIIEYMNQMLPEKQPNFVSIQYPCREFKKIVAVLPAYNAEKTLIHTVKDIPQEIAEIILVDDCSSDKTANIAKEMGIKTIVHQCNKGYGSNLKTCFKLALEANADAIVMVHPDYQYDPRLIPYFVGFMQYSVCDVMLGSRVRTTKETLEGGMPFWKYIFNRFLTHLVNFILGQNLGDIHSGFRCFTREVLEAIPFENNSDDFVFDVQCLSQVSYLGFKIGDAPMPVRYFDEASSINFKRCVRYTFDILIVMGQYLLAKTGIYKSKLFCFKNILDKSCKNDHGAIGRINNK